MPVIIENYTNHILRNQITPLEPHEKKPEMTIRALECRHCCPKLYFLSSVFSELDYHFL